VSLILVPLPRPYPSTTSAKKKRAAEKRRSSLLHPPEEPKPEEWFGEVADADADADATRMLEETDAREQHKKAADAAAELESALAQKKAECEDASRSLLDALKKAHACELTATQLGKDSHHKKELTLLREAHEGTRACPHRRPRNLLLHT
jgi:hypothetical protein